MHYAILTDLNRCVGCLSCAVACKAANQVPIGNYWEKVLRIGPNPKKPGEQCPNTEMYFLPVSCQHCSNPECVKVCPTQASYIASDGTVQIDKSKCIGCQFCVMACPYGVRYLNEEEKV
ncbi:MAG: 4Fe-4S dicluster domain-containing protein, partial [Eggerthellaceae bacterium]|nr:4Fe-4S dicluster domain-containing protein [Eggerthellaceae bacterium]